MRAELSKAAFWNGKKHTLDRGRTSWNFFDKSFSYHEALVNHFNNGVSPSFARNRGHLHFDKDGNIIYIKCRIGYV
ncbi:sugar ABC superfamily ATP binding cassette transporter, sugar-binding protein [Paenibacillus sp. NAIST15-1]|nr:sugar ABC superfamily ATP binding cassette transporter, sugar-binding protein [Paenibacillus sp. NAIST15-1]